MDAASVDTGRRPARPHRGSVERCEDQRLPPKLSPRALEMSTATTHVIVDTPTSSVLDLRQSTGSFQAMTQRVILLGNVIANGAVREAIAARVHIPVQALQISPPLTPQQPTPQAGAYNNSVGAIAESLTSTD